MLSGRQEEVAVDTPAIADFPDELDRLAEWRRRRVEEEGRLGEAEDESGQERDARDRRPTLGMREI